jgi:hypothetical protein
LGGNENLNFEGLREMQMQMQIQILNVDYHSKIHILREWLQASACKKLGCATFKALSY